MTNPYTWVNSCFPFLPLPDWQVKVLNSLLKTNTPFYFQPLLSIQWIGMSDSCDPMDYRLPGSSVHGIFQARILQCIAISFSRGSSQLRDQTHVSCASCISKWILYHWATVLLTNHFTSLNSTLLCNCHSSYSKRAPLT